MDYTKPTLLVISGPNGAGKSTHVESMLPDRFEGVLPFDRDLTRTNFEKELQSKGLSLEQIKSQSAQMMEDFLVSKMNEAIKANQHFVLETPLSHPDYWKYIDRFENNGYQIQLNYLCLDKVKDCEQRVRLRVKEGGHSVDVRTIKGVFERNLEYINDYWNAFKVICLYDGMERPTLLVKMEGNQVIVARRTALRKAWLKKGLPSIAALVTNYLSTQEKPVKENRK